MKNPLCIPLSRQGPPYLNGRYKQTERAAEHTNDKPLDCFTACLLHARCQSLHVIFRPGIRGEQNRRTTAQGVEPRLPEVSVMTAIVSPTDRFGSDVVTVYDF